MSDQPLSERVQHCIDHQMWDQLHQMFAALEAEQDTANLLLENAVECRDAHYDRVQELEAAIADDFAMSKENADLRIEVERLRAAIRELRSWQYNPNEHETWEDRLYAFIVHVETVSRRALTPEEDTWMQVPVDIEREKP